MTEPKLSRLIVIDTREQTPWRFDGHDQVRCKLGEGDYSLEGLEHIVVIERKTIADFVQTVTRGRERFLRELERLRDNVRRSYVFIEADLDDIIERKYPGVVVPAVPIGAMLAFSFRYGVHFQFCKNAFYAERLALRLFTNVERQIGRENDGHEVARSAGRGRDPARDGD